MSPIVGALVSGLAVLLLLAPVRAEIDLRFLQVAASGCGAAVLVWVGVGGSLRVPLAGIVVAVGWASLRHLRHRRARAAAQERATAVVELCEGLAADLRAGQPPLSALRAAAWEWPEFALVADAGRLGGDVAAALRRLAERPGAHGLNAVAAAWVVAHRSGAGLADAVALAARAGREDRATARVVETELASARATARLLAVLPLGVLLIGRGSGGDPFGFLLGSVPGLVCLGAGLLLTWAGLTWLERIARSVQG